jgi:hypothetical protein
MRKILEFWLEPSLVPNLAAAGGAAFGLLTSFAALNVVSALFGMRLRPAWLFLTVCCAAAIACAILAQKRAVDFLDSDDVDGEGST